MRILMKQHQANQQQGAAAGGMASVSAADSSSPKPQPEAQKKKVIRQQQQRLVLLHHASKCTAGPSCRTKFCPQMVSLWRHMKKCRDKKCKTAHCLSSRCVLNHYRICKAEKRTGTCEVCAPVMKHRLWAQSAASGSEGGGGDGVTGTGTGLACLIGVVSLPSDDATSGDGGVDNVEIDLVVSAKRAHEDRTAPSRSDAVEIADSDSGSDEDEGSGPPQPKRARRGDEESAGFPKEDTTLTGNAPYGAARNGQGSSSDGKATLTQSEEEDDGARDGTGADLEATAGGAVTARERPAPTAEAPDAVGNDPKTLRQWLRDLDTCGSKTGRFEAYAAAFEREFDSLEDLALAADNPKMGMEGILQICNVQRMGDRAKIEWAIGNLPRPE